MKNADQPAYAVSKEMCEASKITEYPFGLTKREYFAGLAMQGILANESGYFQTEEKVAEMAVKQADELLKQLETTQAD